MKTLAGGSGINRRSVAAPVGVAIIVLATGACGGSGAADIDGPLSLGSLDTKSAVCVTARDGQAVSFGYSVFDNPSGDTFRVTGYDLYRSDGLDLVGGHVIPIGDQNLAGAQTEYPPDSLPNLADAAFSFDDATIGAEKVYLLIGVRPSSERDIGWAEAVDVTYSDQSGREYVARTNIAIAVVDGDDLQCGEEAWRRAMPTSAFEPPDQ